MADTWIAPKSPGTFMSKDPQDSQSNLENSESPFVRSAEGAEVQARVWQELGEKLETIQPGIMGNL